MPGRQGGGGFPVEPGSRLYTYVGAPATFVQAGFADLTPAGQERRVMRYILDSEDGLSAARGMLSRVQRVYWDASVFLAAGDARV